MADGFSITGEKPSIKSSEDFDVFSGKGGSSRDEYKAATFHNSTEEGADAQFKSKAELMGSSPDVLWGQTEVLETKAEKKMEAGGEKN